MGKYSTYLFVLVIWYVKDIIRVYTERSTITEIVGTTVLEDFSTTKLVIATVVKTNY